MLVRLREEVGGPQVDEEAGVEGEHEGEADAEPVDEAVDRETESAKVPDLVVRPRLLGRVAVVQDEESLDQEPAEEARADQSGHDLRVPDVVHRLGEDIE